MNRVIAMLQYLLFGLFFFAHGAGAQLTIEITGGGANQIPIAVLQFAGEGGVPGSIGGSGSATVAGTATGRSGAPFAHPLGRSPGIRET